MPHLNMAEDQLANLDEPLLRGLAAKFIQFLETGTAPAGLFATDAFCDFTMPQWRLQAQGAEDIVRLRKAGHPSPGRVPRSRFDATMTGFVLEVEEEIGIRMVIRGIAASCSVPTSLTARLPRSRCTARATGTAPRSLSAGRACS